jgi:hypothetical protein
MKKLIFALFASKKFVATATGALAALLVPVLNKKLGLDLTPTELGASLGTVASIVVAFVLAQTHSDIKTGGATSGTVANNAAVPVLPPEVQAALDALAKK